MLAFSTSRTLRRRTRGRRQEQSQPSTWAECAGRTKTTNLHHHQGGSRDVEEIACSSGHVPVHVADRRNFFGRLKYIVYKKQQLGFEVVLLDANTSSTDEVSLVSDTVHLELFSDFARRRHVHHTSDFVHVRFS